LIGGQACIIYGAAEFSRDSDFIVLSTLNNLEHLKKALKALKAKLIYVPPLSTDYLERGHACHFKCNAKDIKGLRIDVISKLRGCDGFDKLWARKKTVLLKNGESIDIIGLRDLVQSKKTQRDKDWLMLKRLVENDYLLNRKSPSNVHIKWWFEELRDANLLVKLAKKYSKIAKECIAGRQLIASAVVSDMQKLNVQLHDEEGRERQKDIRYWTPLKKELEIMRRKR